jgi:conjugative transfer pilus assembly protein TraH
MKKNVLILSLLFQNAYCGVGADLEGFFNKLGAVTNSTSPGVHHDQSAGYYNGGGLSIRNRARNSQLATLQLPNVNAGCGGIDMFTGGFSFVNSAQLVDAMKSIGSSAVSYGFMLAMKTFAPAVQSVMAELQDMASKINQASMNSCEMAATLVGGAWPKSDVASRHICTSMGSKSGMFKGWVAAKHECGAGSNRSRVLAGKNGEVEYKDILAEEFNVAWEVIKRNGYLASDTELGYLCMTVSGTIVSFQESGNRRVVRYPSKVTDDLVKALFEGGNVSGYGCDETGRCLRIQLKDFNIASGGFANRVRKTLSDITQKAINDQPLTKNEIEFIGKVRLPIYKMVNVLTTYKRSEFDLRDFTDIICVDLIHQYISEILDVMLEETANLKNAQVSDEEVNKFISQLQEAKTNINRKRKMAYKQMNQMLIIIESTKIYERKLENTFEVLQKTERNAIDVFKDA